ISWPLSLAGSYTRYESLPMRLSYLGLLASSVWLLGSKRQRDWLVAAFVLGTSIACLKGWLQWAYHAPFRPDGDLGNANLLAGLAVMGIPLAVDRARRGTPAALAWAAAVVVMGAGLLVTTSRSGGLGVLAGCLALIVFTGPRRFSLAIGAGAASVVGIALFVLPASPRRWPATPRGSSSTSTGPRRRARSGSWQEPYGAQSALLPIHWEVARRAGGARPDDPSERSGLCWPRSSSPSSRSSPTSGT